MEEIRIIRKVTKDVIQEIVDRIVRAIDPEKIILFGSYAYGKPRRDSDIDILVIKKSDLPRHKRASLLYKALAGLIIPKDILVYTPEEIEEWSEVPQAFITTIIKRGIVIYEKKKN